MKDPGGNRTPRNPLSPGGGDQKNKNGQTPPTRKPRIPPWVVGLLLVSILGWYVYQYFGPERTPDRTTIPYSVFLEQISTQNVKEATVSTSRVDAVLNQPISVRRGD